MLHSLSKRLRGGSTHRRSGGGGGGGDNGCGQGPDVPTPGCHIHVSPSSPDVPRHSATKPHLADPGPESAFYSLPSSRSNSPRSGGRSGRKASLPGSAYASPDWKSRRRSSPLWKARRDSLDADDVDVYMMARDHEYWVVGSELLETDTDFEVRRESIDSLYTVRV